MSEQDFPDIHLRVLYDFEYVAKDGRKIKIEEGEKLFLIKKTNSDWWQVIRSSSERPFFVPATYVEEYSWNQDMKGPARGGSIEKTKNYEVMTSVSSTNIQNNLSDSMKEEKESGSESSAGEGKCSSSAQHMMSRRCSERKPNASRNMNLESSNLDSLSKDRVNDILLDKRKSWAVEELVAELSKMRTERNMSPYHDFLCMEDEDEKQPSEGSITSSSSHMKHGLVSSSPDDKILCSSKHSLSLERDKADNAQKSKRDSQERNTTSVGRLYSVVNPVQPEESKNKSKVAHKLSESLEKLAQQIQFEPSGTTCTRNAQSKLSESCDEPKILTITEEDNTKMDTMFSKMKSKLSYSSSLKTKKELQQVLKHRGRNSELSTSWENALSGLEGKKRNDSIKVVQEENKFRNSERVLNSGKGQADLQQCQLKESRSGSELDALRHHNKAHKLSVQCWNLVEQNKFGGARKGNSCASGSESEENLNDSMGQDEGSVSGLSDDILLYQSGTSKISYSDVSDGAVSDDLLIESLVNDDEEEEERKQDRSSCLKVEKRKVSLTRRSRVESFGLHRCCTPPSPSPGRQPIRVLNEGWEEYRSSQGRTYYYNSRSHDKSWKPPRRQNRLFGTADDGSAENLRSNTSSPIVEEDKSRVSSYIPVPQGWSEAYDEETGQPCYVHNTSGAKWFSSNDSEGRVYFFEENSNESSWTLPELNITGCDSPVHSARSNPRVSAMETLKSPKDEQQENSQIQLRSEQLDIVAESKSQHRMTKAHSMVLVDSRGKPASSKSSSIPRNWPQLWDGNMCVLKEGTLNRTKITDNGKKLRKNWASGHVVLTELFLLFFKDAKVFAAMRNSSGESSSGVAQPELCVDLNGALLEHGEKASSRRNVFLVSTVLGLQVLLQCDSAQQEEEWYQAIHKVITDLPLAYDSCLKSNSPKKGLQPFSSNSPEETKKSSRIGRSRSVKLKLTSKDGSQEDLTASPDEQQTKIRNRLKKFFHRRPTKEVLVKKGIYKDEAVFGCHLPDVCRVESPRIPPFVQRCIAAIECKEENMKTDGLYRASGNLSQVQKIRLQVDQNNLEILTQEEDVHVLTGALKLFFRELKKPLIPFEHFNKALRASTNPNKKEKLQQFRDIVKALPVSNRDTLEFLLSHLLRVTAYQEFNRMHIPNLAIVFGPTLMWPEAESLNMALDLMQQNLVIECFLQEFNSIFR